MAQTVTISRPHLEALFNAIEAFEEYTAQASIKACKQVNDFDAYLEARRPMLERMFTLKYAVEFGLTPEIAVVNRTTVEA